MMMWSGEQMRVIGHVLGVVCLFLRSSQSNHASKVRESNRKASASIELLRQAEP